MLGMWASVYFALAGRPRWSGWRWRWTGRQLLAITAAPAVLLLTWLGTPAARRRHALAQWCATAGAVLAGIFLPFALLAPRGMYHGMIAYHFNKVARPERDMAVWREALAGNGWLLALALAALGIWLWMRRRHSSPLAPLAGVFVIAHFVFLLAQKRMWAFYFDPLIPACAALGAYPWVVLRARPVAPRWKWAPPVLLAALLAVPLYASVRDYLAHESHYLMAVQPMAEYLAQRAPEGAALFGDSASTPLLALLTGLPVAGNEVDTNVMRFTSGTSPLGSVLDSLRAYPVTYVVGNSYVARGGSGRVWMGVAGLPEFRRLVAGAPFREFHDPRKGTYVIYELSRVPR
ncbi:hypothetical protein HS125_04625 [bacterium]|nr:hypothetical protein [bacterium]